MSGARYILTDPIYGIHPADDVQENPEKYVLMKIKRAKWEGQNLKEYEEKRFVLKSDEEQSMKNGWVHAVPKIKKDPADKQAGK